MYQASLYQYNQRAEVLVPQRRGTTYYGPDNHKPLVAYRGLNVDFDIFVKDTDRKPQSLHNKTYTATILDRTNKTSVLTKTLIPTDYDKGHLVLKLDHEETILLSEKLYDLVVTYTVLGQVGSYGGSSDQNNRITFVLEVRDDALAQLRESEEVTVFQPDGDDFIGGRMEGPALTGSSSGRHTVQVNFTNYTGTYKVQASMSLQPGANDWFDVTNQNYTVSAKTGTSYHTFVGMYTYARVVHTPDPGNTGTLDKVTYRS